MKYLLLFLCLLAPYGWATESKTLVLPEALRELPEYKLPSSSAGYDRGTSKMPRVLIKLDEAWHAFMDELYPVLFTNLDLK